MDGEGDRQHHVNRDGKYHTLSINTHFAMSLTVEFIEC